jgi:broad specificity phosphatase PhoE
MKHVYLIRHAQSEGNVGPVFQGVQTPLTELGRTQAGFMSNRLRALDCEVMIVSTARRAQETAEIIREKLDIKLESSDLFVERRRSTGQLGNSKLDPSVLEIDRLVENNFHIPGYRHSDEENFDDLKVRAAAALQYLANRSEERIAVITHGFFLRILVAYIVSGPELTGPECQRFIRTFHTENTGITAFIHEPERDPEWWVWIWNDHAHLG